MKVYNVRDFGAKGDGVTDDTAAIQLTITTAHNAGGGKIAFPVGDYKIVGTITVYQNTPME